eukprot:TRINITY_DN66235_c5_g2_i1.p1 TRINITY_DN66235_c5_g2~~TRINITY_DN66235_c5_g2_i1.p1  ORF type:complete len:739 (-),score=444.79 TRINITY_DN66235_c5_g2_i1:32-2110(-)
MRADVDNKPPPQFAHLQNRTKKEQMMEERLHKIEQDNRLLLKKMTYIMSHNTIDNNNKQWKPKRSLNASRRRKEMDRINRDNQQILQRIQSAKAFYNHRDWDRHAKVHTDYLKNICDNPVLIKEDGTPVKAKRNPRRIQSAGPDGAAGSSSGGAGARRGARRGKKKAKSRKKTRGKAKVKGKRAATAGRSASAAPARRRRGGAKSNGVARRLDVDRGNDANHAANGDSGADQNVNSGNDGGDGAGDESANVFKKGARIGNVYKVVTLAESGGGSGDDGGIVVRAYDVENSVTETLTLSQSDLRELVNGDERLLKPDRREQLGNVIVSNLEDGTLSMSDGVNKAAQREEQERQRREQAERKKREEEEAEAERQRAEKQRQKEEAEAAERAAAENAAAEKAAKEKAEREEKERQEAKAKAERDARRAARKKVEDLISKNEFFPGPGRFTVSIGKARNLKQVEKKQDPYVRISIADKKQETKTHKDGGENPEWNEELVWELPMPPAENERAVFGVYDSDIGRDDFIAHVAVPMRELIKNGEKWYELTEDDDNKVAAGELLMSAKWTPTGEGDLVVEVVEARDIIDRDSGKQDPYVKMELDGVSKKTATHKDSHDHAVWKETLTWKLPALPHKDQVVLLSLYDDDFGKDDLIGSARVPLLDLLDDATPSWYAVATEDKTHAGDILLHAKFNIKSSQ